MTTFNQTVTPEQYIQWLRQAAATGQSLTVPAADMLRMCLAVQSAEQNIRAMQQAQPPTITVGQPGAQGGGDALNTVGKALVDHLRKSGNGENPIVKALDNALAGKPGSMDNLRGLVTQAVGQGQSSPLLTSLLDALKAKG